MRTPLIFLDTETTGLVPGVHTPWELGFTTAVHDVDEGSLEIVQTRSWFIQLSPEEREAADRVALDIGRFHTRYEVDQAISPLEACIALKGACEQVEEMCLAVDSTPKTHLVGAIPSFDHTMICVNWTGFPGSGQGMWHYHLVDIEALVVGFGQGRATANGYERDPDTVWPIKSNNLVEITHVSIDEERKHTAAGDVDLVLRQYAAVYDLTIID